jgi:hypothetical protein
MLIANDDSHSSIEIILVQIERLLPVAGEYQKQQFGYVLSKQAYHSVSDGHLWFSIFSRPPSSRFTCVQRCTCCFVLLFTGMMLNILYYDQTKETESATASPGISIGPIRITTQQVSDDDTTMIDSIRDLIDFSHRSELELWSNCCH